MITDLTVFGHPVTSNSSYEITSIDGLFGVPDLKGDVIDAPVSAGAIEPDIIKPGARIITVEGECWGATPEAAMAKYRELTRVLYQATQVRGGGEVLFRLDGDTTEYRTTAQVQMQQPLRLENPHPVIKWQFALRASDPFFYGVQQDAAFGIPTVAGAMTFPITFPIPFGLTSGSTMEMLNDGNAPAWPTYAILGPVSWPVIQNVTTGEEISLEGVTLDEGQTLVVSTNPRNRFVTIDGADAFGLVVATAASWWAVAPGGSTARFYGRNGGYGASTAAAAYWRDTFV